MGFFSKGRHRKPSNVKRNAAAVAVAGALSASPVALGSASAAETTGANWGPIIKCESGGDPQAQNPNSSASGLFQFIDGTWRAYGGSTARAKDASVSEQYEVANRAYADVGYTPWDSSKDCWRDDIATGSTYELKIPQAQKPSPTPRRVVEAPAATTVIPKVVHPQGEYTPNTVGNHSVKPGDTLTYLARDYGTTVEKIVADNPHTIEHKDWIYVGENLTVQP